MDMCEQLVVLGSLSFVNSICRMRNQYFRANITKTVGHAMVITQNYKFVRKYLNRMCVVQGPEIFEKEVLSIRVVFY